MFDFWFGLIENKPLAEWKLNLGPKIQEKWGNIFLIATLCFFCISIFGWTICCVCPSTYESTIPLVQTKGCRPSSTGTTSEVVMDIPNQTYGQAHWLSRSKSRLVKTHHLRLISRRLRRLRVSQQRFLSLREPSVQALEELLISMEIAVTNGIILGTVLIINYWYYCD